MSKKSVIDWSRFTHFGIQSMAWIVTTIVALNVYIVAVAVYRIFFSPLANIPGPKLAALSGWYETYYELFHSFGGQFTFHIQELHKQYGVIVFRDSNRSVANNFFRSDCAHKSMGSSH